MQISSLTYSNLLRKWPLKAQNDGLTSRQRDYGMFISSQQNWDGMTSGFHKNNSFATQVSQNINDINEIFTQKILMKSEALIRNKIGDLYPNASILKPAKQTESYNFFW